MKRGRKPILDKTVSVASRLPMSLVPKLEEYTENNGITKSAFIQQLLEAALDPERGTMYTRDEVNRMLQERDDTTDMSEMAKGYIEELENELHDVKSLLERFKEYSTELELRLRNCTDLYKSDYFGVITAATYKKITPTLKRPK